MKILIADDSKTIRRVIRTYLQGMGFSNFEEAEDGQRALEELEKNKPDVMILDWNMPNMTGIEVLDKVRKDERYADLKILMCSSLSEKENVITAIQKGANNYLTKPFTEAAFKEKVESLGVV